MYLMIIEIEKIMEIEIRITYSDRIPSKRFSITGAKC